MRTRNNKNPSASFQISISRNNKTPLQISRIWTLKKLSPLIRICEFKRVWIHIGVSNDIAVLESLVDSARFYNVFVDRGTGVDPFGLVLASISSQKGDFRPNLVSVLPSLIRMRGDSFFNNESAIPSGAVRSAPVEILRRAKMSGIHSSK